MTKNQSGRIFSTKNPTAYESTIEIIHQIPVMVHDSIKNCVRISHEVAPIAFRMPISRVRSVTETSITFIIPIHHTKSDIPAIATIKRVTEFMDFSNSLRKLSLVSR
jgi:hypothetical protein